MQVTGSRRTARLGRAICAFLGGVFLTAALAACGESSRFSDLAPTPEPTPAVAQLLAMVPAGRTAPNLAPAPPPRTPEAVVTMAAPTPIVIETPTPAVNGGVTPPPPPAETPPSDLSPGHQLFIANGCTVCHAEDLSGGIGPALAGRTVDDLTEERIRQQLGEGGNGMPPFPDLTEEQIVQLMEFIRSS
ncbi:MAG: cytochrome c [Chloroflexi bacterium]|nr:cytochrome c [Chloroflexota bacterium]